MYTLKLTEGQACVLRDACELLARVHMGQFDSVVEEVRLHANGGCSTLYEAKHIAQDLERAVFPNGAGPRPERANVAWDLYQVVRHCVAWTTAPPNDDRPAYLVQYGKPLLTSAEEPLATCEVEHTGPLEERIADLEAALGFFIADREESGCCNCPFSEYDQSGSFWCRKEDRKEPQPCKVGWREWAINEGHKREEEANRWTR